MYNLQTLIHKIRLRFYKSHSWNYHLTMLQLHYKNHFSNTKKMLHLKQLNIEIPRNKYLFLLAAYNNALILKTSVDAIFKIENNKLFISIDTLTFEVQTSEELFILKEIFVEGIYNFNLGRDMKNYVLIDIGMNVAYASCYFARVKELSHVVSFEPFLPTFSQAIKNIELNNLEDQIDRHNYGFGSCDKTLDVLYSSEYRGQVGIHGTDYIRSTVTKSHSENIVIKHALEPLSQIETNFSSKRFIMKIDCEGAEYDFIENIPTSMLTRCDLIMMEWHEKGPKSIETWLSKNGFIQMSFFPHSKRAGMIYAVKNI